ncbi:hypothetical protein FOLKNPGA_01324 [Legionella sp. PC1000]|uniref:hypothetical protein n=1 Tax=Legionella sp. PC1000 TaxID=2746060 RepID=UPI0015FE7ED2|nr:hypothetical protein [Legionella sp. PC1000]QLZ68545.1 hypothetical protein FOLKNPGA_01324 [Legionella sp. PC1000]
MGDNKKKKKDKKSESGWLYSIFNTPTSPTPYCTPDQCFMTNQQAFSSTNLIAPLNSEHTTPPVELNTSTPISDLVHSLNLSDLFPPELIQLITDAAQQGLLISMLITLVNEGATDYLKHLHYQPDQIYWINQGIRALLLMALGSSAYIAIATPLAGYVLHAYGGYSKDKSNYITTGAVVGINLLTNPISLLETSIALGTSVCASFLGSKITRSGYSFVRNTFFRSKDVEDNQENEQLTKAQLSY